MGYVDDTESTDDHFKEHSWGIYKAEAQSWFENQYQSGGRHHDTTVKEIAKEMDVFYQNGISQANNKMKHNDKNNKDNHGNGHDNNNDNNSNKNAAHFQRGVARRFYRTLAMIHTPPV